MRLLPFLLFIMSYVPVAFADEQVAEPARTSYSFFTDKTNLITLGLGLGVAGVLYENDQSIYDEFIEKEHHLPAHNTILSFSRNYGKTAFMLPVLATVWFGSLTVPGSELAIATQDAIRAFLISGAIVSILKVTAHRYRPNTGAKAYTFEGPDYFDYDNKKLSFPSGDAQTAWSILASYALAFSSRSIWAPIGCFTVASLVTLGRVYDKAHWPSDAFLGSFIGFMTAYNVYKYKQSESPTGLTIEPSVLQNKFIGMALNYQY